MSTILIAAIDQAGGIGYQGRLPWHAPLDLAWFRAITLSLAPLQLAELLIREGLPTLEELRTIGHPSGPWDRNTNMLLVGPRTFNAMGEMPRRITRILLDGMRWQDVVALQRASEHCFIGGGGHTYWQALLHFPLDALLITEIDGEHKADTYFPGIGNFLQGFLELSNFYEGPYWKRELVSSWYASDQERCRFGLWRRME